MFATEKFKNKLDKSVHIKLDHVPGSLVVVFTFLSALYVYDYSLACDMLCGNCLYCQNSHIVNMSISTDIYSYYIF